MTKVLILYYPPTATSKPRRGRRIGLTKAWKKPSRPAIRRVGRRLFE
jgi:hypothetical protein